MKVLGSADLDVTYLMKSVNAFEKTTCATQIQSRIRKEKIGVTISHSHILISPARCQELFQARVF